MFSSGFLRLGRIRGVPVRFHWSVALGALIFSGFRFAPAFWLAFPVLVLIHELGHALIAQRLGHRALGIEVTGFGGLCHWDPRGASPLHHALVAWGGVVAQLALFVAAIAYLLIRPGVFYAWEAQVLHVFTTTNLFIIVLNLLPFPPLDGARAWTLFRHLRGPGAARLNPMNRLRHWAAERARERRMEQERKDHRNRKQPDERQPDKRQNGRNPAPPPGGKDDLAKVFDRISEEAKNARR